jgi:tRNA modification GTPase
MNRFHKILNIKNFNQITKLTSSIYALASGTNQRSAVAIVRVSGKQCLEVIETLTRNKSLLEPRKMYLRDLFHPIENVKIDKSLVVWFKAPNSFTGEDVVELHVHGGPAVISSVLNSLSKINGLKHAEPGEFSRRLILTGIFTQ